MCDKIEPGMQATMWGVERFKKSELVGKVVCPTIRLWKDLTRERIGGALPHNTPVTIKAVKRGDDGRTYYQVSGKGKRSRIKRGWVSWPFIREADPANEPDGESFKRWVQNDS